ncbi:MAG: hypothetical protein SWO11_12220 [Thermodesulfobacteriota bacterium]|nr:hypothetical protein [Thermodesulfobacteriota bacterium]
MVKTIEGLDHYPWSGHRSIIGQAKSPWMDTAHVLVQFSDTHRKFLSEYQKFMREGVGQEQLKELTSSGLIRSQGGWSQVLAMRSRGRKEEFSEGILGGGDFVDNFLKEAKDSHQL